MVQGEKRFPRAAGEGVHLNKSAALRFGSTRGTNAGPASEEEKDAAAAAVAAVNVKSGGGEGLSEHRLMGARDECN